MPDAHPDGTEESRALGEAVPGRRRQVRISVQALMAVVLLLGCGLGWVVHQANVQRDVVALIKKEYGYVSYDWGSKADIPMGDLPIDKGKPWAPKWLIERVGVDYFGHVFAVRQSRAASDAFLEQVAKLGQLERLIAVGSQVTDAGVAHLEGLSRMRELTLHNTSLGDDGLVHLKGLNRLRWLILVSSKVTDSGLGSLEGLTRLEFLSLNGTKVGDAGLSHLQGMTVLKGLSLDDTAVTDAGLVYLKGLTGLKNLELRGTKVTRAGAEELKRALPNLQIHGLP